MATLSESFIDLTTQSGPMRLHTFLPQANGPLPTVIFYSEIFQVTAPIRRMAAALAGQGFWVVVPEVYHEFEPLGTVLGYDPEGSERGNTLKTTKSLAAYDEDVAVVVEFLKGSPSCSGRIASFGVCLGGHLALRAALHPSISAAVAFYPTDLHTGYLGLGKADDTLRRLDEVKAPMLFVFGRQDPHIPRAGRELIHQTLEEIDADFEWHEFNAAHAFLRDEGTRYNPALARVCDNLMMQFLDEKIR